MARIVHLAIKVDDIEKAAAFWEQVFGFRRSDVQKKRGHTSCHLTDGEFDLALVQYESEQTVEADWAGPGPRLHHLGFAVSDYAGKAQELENQGCTILSQPGVLPIKVRAPHGIVAEVGPATIYPGVADRY
jgi:lactoylglutathione lyase